MPLNDFLTMMHQSFAKNAIFDAYPKSRDAVLTHDTARQLQRILQQINFVNFLRLVYVFSFV